MNQRKNRFFEKVTASASLLTPTEKNIASHLMQTYPNCLLKNASELAREIKINSSTMTRFFQKIGYRNIREAQCEFRDDIASQLSSPIERFGESPLPGPRDSVLTQGMNTCMQNIQKLCSELSVKDLYRARDLMLDNGRRVYVCSDQGRSLGLAHYFFSQITAVRSGVTLLATDTMALANKLADLDSRSVLFVFDFRPYVKLNQKIAGIFKRHKGQVVVLADSPISPIAETADITFAVPTQSSSPFESFQPVFFLVEILMDLLARERMDEIRETYKRLEKSYIEFDVFF